MKANRIVPAAALALIVSACSAPPPPAPPAPPPPQPRAVQPAPPPPPAPADWRNAPRTQGNWTWAMENGRSTARYGVAGEPPVATLTCERASRTTILWRTGAASGQTVLVVTTTGTRRVLDAQAPATGGVAARLPAADPILDAMVFSRGRFMLEMPENAALYLPSWPEIARVVEDCRKG